MEGREGGRGRKREATEGLGLPVERTWEVLGEETIMSISRATVHLRIFTETQICRQLFSLENGIKLSSLDQLIRLHPLSHSHLS